MIMRNLRQVTIFLGVLAAVCLFDSQFPQYAANGTYLFTLIHVFLAIILFIIAPIGAADPPGKHDRAGG